MPTGSLPATRLSSENLYFDLLLQEFELYSRALQTRSKTLVGFDIGGGTPSIAAASATGNALGNVITGN